MNSLPNPHFLKNYLQTTTISHVVEDRIKTTNKNIVTVYTDNDIKIYDFLNYIKIISINRYKKNGDYK